MMSRQRPQEEIRSNYITPEGAKKLREELDYLWKEERPRVTQAVSEAAAQGDRSENADYIYGKRRLREIDRRIRHLTLRLDAVKVVSAPPTHTDRVFFGAWVLLENEAGDETEYRIVGPDETSQRGVRVAHRRVVILAVAGFQAGPIQQRQVHQAVNDGHVVCLQSGSNGRNGFINAAPSANESAVRIEPLIKRLGGGQSDFAILPFVGKFIQCDGIKRVEKTSVVMHVQAAFHGLFAIGRRKPL